MSFDFVQASQPREELTNEVAQILQSHDYFIRFYNDNSNGVYHTVGLSRKTGVEFFLNLNSKDAAVAVEMLVKLMGDVLEKVEYNAQLLKEGVVPDVIGYHKDGGEVTDKMGIYLMKVDPAIIPIVAPVLSFFNFPNYTAYQIVLPNENGEFPWESKSPYLGPDDTYVQQHVIRPPMKHLN